MAKAKNNLVEVYIPREGANADPNEFCAINGKNYIMPRGKKSMVPDFVAAEVARSQAAKDKMYEERDRLKGALPEQSKTAR